jgi:hypothetical protein
METPSRMIKSRRGIFWREPSKRSAQNYLFAGEIDRRFSGETLPTIGSASRTAIAADRSSVEAHIPYN